MSTFVRLLGGDYELNAGIKILKSRALTQFTEAQSVVTEARELATQIEADARQRYEDERERGYREGMEKAKAEMAQRMHETIGATLDHIASVETEMADIVINGVRKVLGEFDDSELVARVAAHLLSSYRDQQRVVLRVAAGQESDIENALKNFPLGDLQVTITGDAGLATTDCVLETSLGLVDASVDVQLDALRQAMAGRFQDTD